jgi:hypothetical protein
MGRAELKPPACSPSLIVGYGWAKEHSVGSIGRMGEQETCRMQVSEQLSMQVRLLAVAWRHLAEDAAIVRLDVYLRPRGCGVVRAQKWAALTFEVGFSSSGCHIFIRG